MNLYELSQPSKKKKTQLIKENQLAEYAPGGGGSGDYLRALASAWYNGVFNTGSLPKGIKTQEDVERLLNRGIVCPDGKTRKLHIDYNSDFNGVEIYSDDYYEHGDESGELDSRTGQPWGPYDHMEFKDEELDEGVAEGSDSYTVANDPDKPGMHSYREVGHAVQSGHSDAAKIYKNNKFLGTVGDVRKQGVAEGHADQQRKIFKKNGHPVGEVGIDRESSPGNGQWYMKYYATGDDFGGYDSMEEAVAELKHCMKQGVAEGKEELHTQLQSINQKLKLMRGGPVGEPNSMAFVEKRKELLKQKEQILSQLKQGVAEAVWDRPSQSYVPRDGRTFGQTNHPREEHCDACGAATGHAGPGEDSNVDDEGNVYCDDCYADQKGVAEGSYDDDKGITHTRGSLVAKLEALPKGSDDFEWNRIQAIHHLKQGNMLRAKYYMALMKRGEQGVAEAAPSTELQDKMRQVRPKGKGITRTELQNAMRRKGKKQWHCPECATYDDNVHGKFCSKYKPKEQGVAEGEVTKTATGLKHRATDKYGAGNDEPHHYTGGRSGFSDPGKYARDLEHVNKQLVKDLDASMGISWKNRGTKGVEVDEELTMKHQRDHHTQRRPDISNSLADRGFDMSEKPNVTKSADGHPTVKWRHHGHAGHTRVEPTLNPTTVQRKDTRPIPSWLKKEQEVDEAGMLGFMQPEPGKPEAKKPKLTLSQIRDLSKQEDERSAQYVRSNDLPKNPDHRRVVHDDVELSELSNELLGRYKKELGVRATAADRAGDYDAGHEYFKKINRATVRQGDNDARRHAEKENDMMETRLNMMRKAGYDL